MGDIPPTAYRKTVSRHAHMVFDWERTFPLLKAIAKMVTTGDVVADIGCGLGFLSFAAVHAGAKRVYAIDVDSEALDFARWQAKQLGWEKKIIFLEDHSFNIDLIEKVDCIIQETIGPLTFDENFLTTLIDAKKRWLKSGGKIIPEKISLWGVPVDRKRNFLSAPTKLKSVQTRHIKNPIIDIHRTWRLPQQSSAKGILLWPEIEWAPGCKTNAAPTKPRTHWGQTLLPVTKGCSTILQCRLQISPHPGDPFHFSEVSYGIKRAC